MKTNHINTLIFLTYLLFIIGCSSDKDEFFEDISPEFHSDMQNIYENSTIQFFDESTGNPTSWQWTFKGGTPSNSSEQNPNITYSREGVFKVSLTASNGGDSNSITKEGYVTVSGTLSNGLVAKYDLDGNGEDSSQFGNHGSIEFQVQTISNRKGMESSAMSFSDFGNYLGYIEVGDVDELKLTSEISISVWVNQNGMQYGWDAIVNKWTNGLGYYLGINPDGLTLRWNVSNQIIETNEQLPFEEWVHIVAIFNGAKLKLYINGAIVKVGDSTGELKDNNAPFTIGNQSVFTGSLTNKFNGGIDDVRIYNRELTSNEVMELYNE